MHQSLQTYFVTTITDNRRSIFQVKRNADLMVEILFLYRDQKRYALHAFVVMPDHIHAIITPDTTQTIERCMQCVKGGFSHAYNSTSPIWQRSFHEHRLRDREDYAKHVHYIEQNPTRRGLLSHRYIHTDYRTQLDPEPQHLQT